MPCFVYLAECSDGTYYCGIAKDVSKRLAMHNAGRASKYTRPRRPVRLVYCERKKDRGSALRREIEIKKMARGMKESLIRQPENRTKK
ncbi:MAG TPA: GIY-YIG nuclease family protein [Candidatus Diapherotrites archaeon]|uniref:GIY-YIG nuclease family protein n=1 Tax=Candidatus Iainarchaeum sp. TaxID=3101447 RepID=A0A7J4IX81_9ARCH|nr:GIY-YIG nuclease family protein [Candidatus Diapherotrites archaeon]